MTPIVSVFVRGLICGALIAATSCLSGCATYTHHAIPASRLPHVLTGPSRNGEVPVNLALLRQDPPIEHTIDTGDVLGVFVQGVIPPQLDEPAPLVAMQGNINSIYYPPFGQVNSPSIGVPFHVGLNGNLELPLVSPVKLTGLSLTQAAEVIRKAYVANDIVKPGRDRIQITLLRARVHRILVVREDSGSEISQMMRKDGVLFAKQGQAAVVDLPAYENDVLHALTATGGLPGLDCVNQVWILRTKRVGEQDFENTQAQIEAGRDPRQILDELCGHTTAVRIPLRTPPHEPLPFGRDDIVLQDGDIVYIEPRIADVYYTGGLLPGGQIPLPRDHDIDVVEAIAMAQGSVGGPGGVSGASVFRAGAGPGNIIPPTRALVVRKLPNGEQFAIRVDLSRAMRDSKERVIIQSGDMVMLHYKPGEIAANVALNFFNFNILLDPTEFN